MAQTPEEMAASMVANFPERTGRPLEEWLEIVRGTDLAKHGEIVAFLKKEHGMGHGYASLVAHKLKEGPPVSDDDLVASQYAGPKAGLRPIYDALVGAVTTFGDEVELAPKKSYVSLRRRVQFGLIQPSTRTRVDVGIKLPGVEPGPRLEASGSFNTMVTHRVRVTAEAEVDDELVGWLRRAYDAAG